MIVVVIVIIIIMEGQRGKVFSCVADFLTLSNHLQLMGVGSVDEVGIESRMLRGWGSGWEKQF